MAYSTVFCTNAFAFKLTVNLCSDHLYSTVLYVKNKQSMEDKKFGL